MDEYWMGIALEEAQKAAEAGEIPVGAVLVKNGIALCRAHNRREMDHDPTAHAELLCMREAAQILGDWRLRDCTVYVTLEPCPMCAGAMLMSQLSRCVWGAADASQGCCGSVYDLPADSKLHGSLSWQGGVLEGECKQMIQQFFEKRRR